MAEPTTSTASEEQLEEMIAESDTGARNPTGAIPKKILFFVPLASLLSSIFLF
jgi:hypothetical protein